MLKGVTVKLISVTRINLVERAHPQHRKPMNRSKTYIVPLITGVVSFPKIAPPGCEVVAVVPLMFDNGVYVVFSCEIHAAN